MAAAWKPLCNAVNTIKLSFKCSVMMVPKVLVDAFKKMIFGPKTAFWPEKAHFGHFRAKYYMASDKMGTRYIFLVLKVT